MKREIYSFETRKDGKQTYHIINGDSLYSVKEWTKEEATTDYQTDAAYLRDWDSTYRAWCD